jgi:hypothetical protein
MTHPRNDQALKLHTPYVYCHQGACEHRMIFTDVRMIQGKERETLFKAPQITLEAKRTMRKCQICEILSVRPFLFYVYWGGKVYLCMYATSLQRRRVVLFIYLVRETVFIQAAGCFMLAAGCMMRGADSV